MAESKRCPECGGGATVIHMYDTYDRADFGWSAGCGRYRAGDGIHTKEMKVSGLPSKEKAIEAWNRRATMAKYIDREALEKAMTIAAANGKDKDRRTWAKAI